MRLRPGDTFDRYTIELLLGEGGMGEVYRAHDTRLRRGVALKVLRSDPGADADTWGQAVERMLREARAAAALSHPNVVGLYDMGEHEGVPFLAMELVQGTPLRRYIGAGVPQATQLRWLVDVARALAAAHRAGLVHRDVKPENVMIRDDGVLKVLDFGIARRIRMEGAAGAVTTDGAHALVTGPGVLLGTPAYMAPEQLRGDELDGRADQFSWAVMAYELLSGKPPFGAGRGSVAILAAVVGEPAPPLEGVPEPVAAAVRRALEKDRDRRFPSMDDLIAELEPLAAADGAAGPASARCGGTGAGGAGSNDACCAGAEGAGSAGAGGARSAGGAGSAGGAATISAVHAGAGGRAPAQRRAWWPFAAAAAALLCAGAAAAARWAAPPAPAPQATAPVAPPAPAPTPLTALPPPKTSSPEALAAYREGLQAFRDARWRAARAAFLRAVELDPSFAAANLRLALSGDPFDSVTETRTRFQRAVSLRASLDERDLALLEALEPQLLREPPDRKESLRRLQEASRRYPGDAELVSLQTGPTSLQDPAAALALTERCLALDPSYADCWQFRAITLLSLGRRQEALAASDRCLEVSPSATDCLIDRARVHGREGSCDRYEADVRRWMAQTPDSPLPYFDLAFALYAQGRPLPGVREVLEQGIAQLPEQDAAVSRSYAEGRFATLSGDLRAAERAFADAAARRADDAAEMRRLEPLMALLELHQELGQTREAARLADAFLNRRDALLKTPNHWVMNDFTVLLLAAKLRGGLMTRAEYEGARRAWLDAWAGQISGELRSAAWYMAYALPASTPEEARDALDVLPASQVSPGEQGSMQSAAVLGKVHLLAGRPAEAIPLLSRAAASCDTLRWPILHTVTLYRLGLAHELQGDQVAACTAYRRVLDRWPEASGSRTAREAAARAKALQCPR